MDGLELVLVALATWHAVEVFHHGSIFAETRGRLETESASPANRLVEFVCDLLLCPFCLSLWVSTGVSAWVILAASHWWLIPIYGLAAARLANLANDATRWFSHTPGRYGDFDSE